MQVKLGINTVEVERTSGDGVVRYHVRPPHAEQVRFGSDYHPDGSCFNHFGQPIDEQWRIDRLREIVRAYDAQHPQPELLR